MRKTGLIFVAVLAIPVYAQAQGTGDRNGWIYGVAGGGYLSNGGPTVFTAAGGGEYLPGAGLGVGAELGYVSRSGSGLGLASVNVSYHFGGRSAGRRLVPFVTGGGSMAFRDGGSTGGGNFGGGVQYWFGDRLALRLELRDHIFSSDSPHTVLFRIGVAFR